MPFVKVVEDSEICNFPILHLVHFSSIFERKMSSKSPRLKHSRARARQRRAAPPRRPCRPHLSEVAHLPQVPAPRDTLESACHAPSRRSRRTHTVHRADRRSVRGSPSSCAVPRRHLHRRRHEPADHLFKRRPSPSRVRHAHSRACPLHRATMAAATKLPLLPSFVVV
jgi:hypothetical protein